MSVPVVENTAPNAFRGGETCTNPPAGGDIFPSRVCYNSTPSRSHSATRTPLMNIVRVLNLELAEDDSRRIRAELEKSFDLEWRRAANLEEFRKCLRSDEWDLIVSANQLADSSGIEAFETVADEGADIPFIIVSGSIDQESAVAAMRLGVSDYLRKDDLARLVPAVTRALLEAADRREMRAAEKALAESEDRLRLALRAAGIGAWEWDLN